MRLIIEKYLGILVIGILLGILTGRWALFLIIPVILIWFFYYFRESWESSGTPAENLKYLTNSVQNLGDSGKIEELFRENELFSQGDFRKFCDGFVEYYRNEKRRFPKGPLNGRQGLPDGHQASLNPEFILKSYLVFRNS
jgi:hypothetical protein